jgi:hypothetical protein
MRVTGHPGLLGRKLHCGFPTTAPRRGRSRGWLGAGSMRRNAHGQRTRGVYSASSDNSRATGCLIRRPGQSAFSSPRYSPAISGQSRSSIALLIAGLARTGAVQFVSQSSFWPGPPGERKSTLFHKNPRQLRRFSLIRTRFYGEQKSKSRRR